MPLDPTPSEDASIAVLTLEEIAPDNPWQVILANDPVNLAAVVVMVLIRVLKCTPEVAERYMLLAHSEGTASVFTGSLPEATRIAAALMAHQLWASVTQDGDPS